ncbi:MAG TPA: hypothetical protein DCY37_01950, partial [Acidaminococcaceae bacterium]|nr:hypothetical protein [Acidaminococcaceae bacterium]
MFPYARKPLHLPRGAT